jgi:hypothetical protein
MRVLHVVAETPLSFLQHLKDITFIERRPLRHLPFTSYLYACAYLVKVLRRSTPVTSQDARVDRA